MKKNVDTVIFTVLLAVILVPFFIIPGYYAGYASFNAKHGMLMSFVKFALLATIGEMIAAKIRVGSFIPKGFGIVQRMLVWGFLGCGIKMAFTIFSAGTVPLLQYLGLKIPPDILKQPFSALKLLAAFSVSVTLNVVFAPVMMTVHRITDTHIARTGGSFPAFFRTPLRPSEILGIVDWKSMYGFVFARTIPIFWIPAHTVTFLLPVDFQILYAAGLSVVLGVILAFAARKKNP